MKPLLRWNLGPTSDAGKEVLKTSIEAAKFLFPEFDLVLCYNQIKYENFGIDSVDGSDYQNCLSIKPDKGYNVHWKLYPSRLRLGSHELVVDNDIVFTNRPPEVDDFLASDSVLFYQGLNAGNHGRFDNFVPKGLRVNSGIYGLPPKYDFTKAIETVLQKSGVSKWESYFDEQGLVAACLVQYPVRQMLSLARVPIIERNWDHGRIATSQTCGFHFVGVNDKQPHEGWQRFKDEYSSCIKLV